MIQDNGLYLQRQNKPVHSKCTLFELRQNIQPTEYNFVGNSKFKVLKSEEFNLDSY